MHITLVSQCEKKALKRTRSLIDRYAVRISDRSWATLITTEALEDLKLALRRGATRQTAIACYVNHGKHDMRLAWTIGRADAFGANGALAVRTSRRPRAAPPLWVRIAALTVKAAGLAHDLGKGSIHFQDKLKTAISEPSSKPIKDETRHEWVSLKLYQAMRECNDFQWSTAWQHVRQDHHKRDMPFSGGSAPLSTAFDAVDFAILTHHGLLAPRKEKGGCGDSPEISGHTGREGGEGTDVSIFSPASEAFPEAVLRALAKATERLEQIQSELDQDPEWTQFWRGIAIISRAALILSDHEVSSTECNEGRSSLFANTRLDRSSGARKFAQKPKLNQKLDWHLEQVAARAQELIHHFHDPLLPSLSQQTLDTILTPSGAGRYQWQDEAVLHLRQAIEAPFQPTLIFNLAGTGSGKTRMNVKALAALRAENEPVRIAAGFNLRTLTLQTHRAFRQQLGMSADETACVIGDRFSRAMHETSGSTDEDDEKDILYETTQGYPLDYPSWLVDIAEKHPELTNLIGAPVLVSTMDYLVNAGDPSKQGHHAHALLRIASSDLILDEVDSYSPDSLVAVMRVVQMAGLFGRHVVASSATLCEPVAKALFDAYRSGVAMFSALRKNGIHTDTRARISFIDNQLPPFSFSAIQGKDASDNFVGQYEERLRALVSKTQALPTFRPCVFRLMTKPANKNDAQGSFLLAIRESVEDMHRNQAWTYDPHGKKSGKHVSFGLIRVATVKNCVAMTKALNDMPNVHVTAYHSVDLRLRRTLKEQALDRLFYRNPDDGQEGNAALLADPEIQRRVASTPGNDVIFIVVATPVEEVGRDHDFDWAVIEPSSMQSIVQLAGRVNRHRLKEVDKPNTTILQFNYRALRGESKVFLRPGNEVGDVVYPPDAMSLIGEKVDRIDAALRFGGESGKCAFSKLDDESIRIQLRPPTKVILAQSKPLAWITRCHYERYPLREKSDKLMFRVSRNAVDKIIIEVLSDKDDWREASQATFTEESPSKPYWLAPGLEEMLDLSINMEDESLRSEAMVFETHDTSQIQFNSWIGGY